MLLTWTEALCEGGTGCVRPADIDQFFRLITVGQSCEDQFAECKNAF